MKIRKDDIVVVTTGKDRGKKGKVLRGFPEAARVLVEGVNIRKKHVRPKKQGEKGQIVEIPAAISVANVKLVCPACKKATRVGYRFEGAIKRRMCKQCAASL